jgi:hypothetical protein
MKGIGQMIFIVSRKDAESAKEYSIIYFAVFARESLFNFLYYLLNTNNQMQNPLDELDF